jgi:hypothetical protein
MATAMFFIIDLSMPYYAKILRPHNLISACNSTPVAGLGDSSGRERTATFISSTTSRAVIAYFTIQSL